MAYAAKIVLFVFPLNLCIKNFAAATHYSMKIEHLTLAIVNSFSSLHLRSNFFFCPRLKSQNST